MQPQYKKTSKGWQFQIKGEDLLFETKEIAILYRKNEDGTATVHRHGPKKTMEEELLRYNNAYQKAGLNNEADAHRLIDVTLAEENALNHIISTSLLQEEKILALQNPNPFLKDIHYPVPLTHDLGEMQKHLLAGGKILSTNLLENKQRAIDLALILKEAGAQPTDPKDFIQEMLVWPDGTEIPREDFDEREWEHRSDDYTIVSDMDEDMREFLQKAITTFSQKGNNNKIIPIANPSENPFPQKAQTSKIQESKALSGLPTTPAKNDVFPEDVKLLGELEATIENEEAHRNAKRALAKNAIAQNLPPDRQWHHIPLYRELAIKKIMETPEPAEISNIRIEILKKEIEINLHAHLGKNIPLEKEIEDLAKKLAPTPNNKKENPDQELSDF